MVEMLLKATEHRRLPKHLLTLPEGLPGEGRASSLKRFYQAGVSHFVSTREEAAGSSATIAPFELRGRGGPLCIQDA